MKKFILQIKTRFGWEDLKYYFDRDIALKEHFLLRTRSYNVRLIEVIK